MRAPYNPDSDADKPAPHGGAPARRVDLRRDSDWPALLDLWVAAWRSIYKDLDFDARRDWLVAHVAALEAIGAAALLLFEEAEPAPAGFVTIDPASGWLDQICVRPDLFGAGAAQALIGAARSVSPARVRLDVNADNARAIRFYEREGFLCVGDGPTSFSGRPTVLMEWRPRVA
jgi:putative acetyltransferase